YRTDTGVQSCALPISVTTFPYLPKDASVTFCIFIFATSFALLFYAEVILSSFFQAFDQIISHLMPISYPFSFFLFRQTAELTGQDPVLFLKCTRQCLASGEPVAERRLRNAVSAVLQIPGRIPEPDALHISLKCDPGIVAEHP